MWIADGWKDYELLDCGGGEKLERWDKQILVRPDPQAIWETDHSHPGWRRANGRYSRSSSGGGHWDKGKLPESWPIHYKELTFQVKPMNFKHTGLFPEQAANWAFMQERIRCAGAWGYPPRVLNLFAYTGGATLACGTGACAVAAAAVLTGRCPRGAPILVQLPGGTLEVCVQRDDTVLLTGDAAATFSGTVLIQPCKAPRGVV